MYKNILRFRLLALLNKKDISEYQLSLDLGRCQSYIHSITSGRNLPSMDAFFDICEFFDITPGEFFDEELKDPTLIHEIMKKIKKLDEEDLLLLISVLNRVTKGK